MLIITLNGGRRNREPDMTNIRVVRSICKGTVIAIVFLICNSADSGWGELVCGNSLLLLLLLLGNVAVVLVGLLC